VDCHTPTVLSLCTGAGGLDLGLKLAMPGARAVCYVEGETYAAAQLAARMADKTLDAAPVWSDVRTFDPEPWRGCVDIITAGYPCQPFSIAGSKLGEKDPRHLWPFIREIVRVIEPKVCFFENVSHHLRLGFEQVHDDLREMGFGVEAGLFTAEEVGAPHKRERLFILAHRESIISTRPLSKRDKSRQSKKPPRNNSNNVAHAQSTGAWLDQLDTWQGISGNSEKLVDPTGHRKRRKSENLSEKNERPHEQCPQLTGSSSQSMAYTSSERLEGHTGNEPAPDRSNIAGEYGLPIWPPGPEEREQWGVVPDAFKPAVHRMADGMAYRVDRLRACGNGVVPLVAAYAFWILKGGISV